MKESGTISQAEQLQIAHLQALRLVEHLQALTAEAPPERLPWLLDLIVQAQEVVTFLSGGAHPANAPKPSPTPKQLLAFGKLLRDRRNTAGFSRIQLARRAKLSDSTIKFLETARHPPSRATLIRLLSVEELKLTAADAPGAFCLPAPERVLVTERPQPRPELNCLVTPTFDPVRRILELGRFLNGAGGHVAQINAYLDHQSAAAYLGLCHKSAVGAVLRASTPLGEAARRIVAATGPVALHVFALGSGDATLEVRLARHLLEEARPRLSHALGLRGHAAARSRRRLLRVRIRLRPSADVACSLHERLHSPRRIGLRGAPHISPGLAPCHRLGLRNRPRPHRQRAGGHVGIRYFL